jgi:hypothetical protein
MRKANEIYHETKVECTENNCQGLEVMAILSIEKAQKEMFEFLQDKAFESGDEKLINFFDNLEKELILW